MNLATATHPHPLREDKDGVIRVGDTRVTLESLLALYDQGAGPEEIALRFPVLTLAEVYGALSFTLSHPREIEAYLEQQRAASARARDEAAKRSPTTELRQKLLRRATR